MKSLVNVLAVAASLASMSAFAQVGTLDTYCGKPVFSGPNDLNPDALLVGGLVVTSSTNANVKQVIKKFGKHHIEFTYEDSPHLRRIAEGVSPSFQHNHSATEVCIDGSAEKLSRWGTPVVVFPVRVLD